MTLIETKARQHEQTYSIDHRKLLGTHYTPDSVVDYIVNRTLRPYLESPELFTNIRILDPACGSGLFLLKAYDVLAMLLEENIWQLYPQRRPTPYRESSLWYRHRRGSCSSN